ncbi:hypothetical protein L7F22_009080 [Adiantum nelumboides]|nr:hypothetical protein [Adiantum nelumboides]
MDRPLVIVIPIFHGFTALDAIGPYEATASFLDFPHPDVIVVPGGFGTRSLIHDRPILDWLRQAHETSIFTTSVCTGSLLLAAAGILQGLEATTHWNAYNELERLGVKPVAQRVVKMGKIITAAGVSAGIDMAIELAALLRDEETAKVLQLYIEYDPKPPYDVGSVDKAGKELVERTREFVKAIRHHN